MNIFLNSESTRYIPFTMNISFKIKNHIVSQSYLKFFRQFPWSLPMDSPSVLRCLALLISLTSSQTTAPLVLGALITVSCFQFLKDASQRPTTGPLHLLPPLEGALSSQATALGNSYSPFTSLGSLLWLPYSQRSLPWLNAFIKPDSFPSELRSPFAFIVSWARLTP